MAVIEDSFERNMTAQNDQTYYLQGLMPSICWFSAITVVSETLPFSCSRQFIEAVLAAI